METLTIPTLRRAIESRDGRTLAGFYADEATLRIIDQMNPPSQPLEINGREAIASYYDEICGRTMTHTVDAGMIEGNQLAFTQTCTYPDGKRVFCASNMELVNGKIARQISIQAWDP
jgi:SnoaL-like domain